MKEPRPQAIPIWIRRVLLLGLSLIQAIMSTGVWNPVAGDGLASTLIHLLPVCTALLAAGTFAVAFTKGGRVTRTEWRAARLLVFNTLFPAVPWLGLMLWNTLGPNPTRDHPTPDDAALIGLLALGSMVIHGIPALFLAAQTKATLGQDDSDWSPHRASQDERFSCIMGLSMLIGAWTAGLGLLGFQLIDRHRWGGSFEESLIDTISISVVFGEAFGAILGIFAGLLLATFMLNTRLDRSVPLVFGTGMVFGIGGSLLMFIGGAATAVLGLAIGGVIAFKKYRLIPLGRCQRCNYDMAGISDPVCPECGLQHQPHESA